MELSEQGKVIAIMRDNSLHAYLATCDGEQPQVRPVSPIVEDDMTVWLTTFSTSRKVKQIKANPRICLAFVEQPDGEKAATIIGEAKIIDSSEQKKRVWGLAGFDLSRHFPDGAGSKEFCLVKILIKKVEWRDSWTGGTNVYKP